MDFFAIKALSGLQLQFVADSRILPGRTFFLHMGTHSAHFNLNLYHQQESTEGYLESRGKRCVGNSVIEAF